MDRTDPRLGIVNRGEPAVRALTAVAELNQAGRAATDPHRRALHRSGRRLLVRARGRRRGAARDRDVRRPGRRHAPIALSR